MIEFIEKDGQLFRKVEPYPLELDTPKPCIVQLIQDDTQMGKYNKAVCNPSDLEQSVVCSSTSYMNVVVDNKGTAHTHYFRFEVIAEHCPEGGVYWALWQMIKGKIVTRNAYIYRMSNEGIETSTNDLTWDFLDETTDWLENTAKNGWRVFNSELIKGDTTGIELKMMEIEPELRLFVGHWYITFAGDYVQYSCTKSGKHLIRHAGNEHCAEAENKLNNSTYFGATLEPDFTNAKVGDEVWNCLRGKEKINTIGGSGDYPISIEWNSMPLDFYTITGRHNINHKHPTLFHSFEHFLAYHKEAEYQRKRGNKELSVEDREGEQE